MGVGPMGVRALQRALDDARGQFRALYVGATRLACYLEVTAQFRPDPGVTSDLDAILGDAEDDIYPATAVGIIPSDWRERRVVGAAEIAGSYVDIGSKESLSWLRSRLASRLIHYGVPDMDGATIRSTVPRALTQEMSSLIYATAVGHGSQPDGIRFESSHGNGLILPAIFERPVAGDAESSRLLTARSEVEIDPSDPELLEAAYMHGLTLE